MQLDPRQKREAEGAATPDAESSPLTPPAIGPETFPRCPNCGWQDVRPSHSKGALDLALAVFSIAPFRCRSCSHRFYRFHRRAREL